MVASAPAADDRGVAAHGDASDEWPERAWALASLGAAGGAAFGLLIEGPDPLPIYQLVVATFVFVAFVALALTLERRRWTWSVGAAVAVGGLLALVGWNTAQLVDSRWEFDWAPASALVASLVLLPLFQTVRDEGALRLPPDRVHGHVWADFVIGAVGLLFVGVVLLLLVLIDELLQLVGIEAIRWLWRTDWFGWAVAGAAFGAVAARLRDRAGLLGTLLTVKFTVLAVLAPVLAVAIAIFLGALPFGGLARFWAATGESSAILLACAVLAVWLLNSVIGSDRATGLGGRALRAAALVLAVSVLPLAGVAAAGLWIRVDALGWTPTRLWGAATLMVGLAWGGLYLWSVVRARGLDDRTVLEANVRLAVGLAVAALILALPVVSFGAISTRSQMARLAAGNVGVDEFDWRAMARDFGPAGRRALKRIEGTGSLDQRLAATDALNPNTTQMAPRRAKPQRITVRPAGAVVPSGLRDALRQDFLCTESVCDLMLVEAGVAVLRYREQQDFGLRTTVLTAEPSGAWSSVMSDSDYSNKPAAPDQATLAGRVVEVRPLARRQLFIDGKVIGEPFE